MTIMTTAFESWRGALEMVHAWFDRARVEVKAFNTKAFFIFFALNLACFWWALLTAYPEKVFDQGGLEYILIGFPVSILGALFDVASLRVTLWAISKALGARSNTTYVAFLGVDLVIAVVATFWVLFAFIVSGWLVGHVIPVGETLGDRADLYQDRVASALDQPLARESIKNVYFGVLMGASAMIPTIVHALLALSSFVRAGGRALAAR